jgi:endonuclease YncB( thermonuclease family)
MMAVIRNIRGGTVGLNEEDRLMIARLLVKAGYAVKIGYRTIPGNAKGKKEYIVEYWEEKEKKIEM